LQGKKAWLAPNPRAGGREEWGEPGAGEERETGEPRARENVKTGKTHTGEKFLEGGIKSPPCTKKPGMLERSTTKKFGSRKTSEKTGEIETPRVGVIKKSNTYLYRERFIFKY
jgi:hypothetical protein